MIRSRKRLSQALAIDSCDFVMPDLMRIGGVTGWLRTPATAEAANIEMSEHANPEFAAHLMHVTNAVHWLEWQDRSDPR